jgi:hypothetical protein
MRAIIWLTYLAILCRTQSSAAEPEWIFRWEPDDGTELVGKVEHSLASGYSQRLRILTLSGEELGSTDGEEFLGAASLPLAPRGDERLFLTHWSSGNSYCLLVFRYSRGSVVQIDRILFEGESYTLFDVDGDGFAEVLVYRQVAAKGLPRVSWPYEVEIYKWNGSRMRLLGKASKELLQEAIEKLLGFPPLLSTPR